MKKCCLLFLLVFILLKKGNSQIEVPNIKTNQINEKVSDLINTSPNRDFEKRINIKPITESANDVEIRFYTHKALTNTSDLKIIKLKKGNWEGTSYIESNNPILKIRKYKVDAKNGFEKLYESLLINNLTSLPSQKELRQKMRKVTATDGWEVEHRRDVTDGQSFTVEFKISENSRIYTFYNPEPYSEFYPDVQELKNFVTIKNLFETELKKK